MSAAADRPIADPRDDALGLTHFAQALAAALFNMDPREGMALSVEGPWGGGKSSALALAIRELKLRELNRLGPSRASLDALDADALDRVWRAQAPQRAVHIVRFNPWTWSGQDNLTRAFFAELSAQIGARQGTRWRRRLARFGTAAKWMSELASPVLSFLGVVFPYAMVAAKAADMASALGKDERSLEQAKAALAEALREAGGRVVVVVDDLDRLMPAEMRAMLSLVKSLGDLTNVIYVLAYDPQVVRKALESERIEPDFVAKIVQVSLALPPPCAEDLRRLLDARLTDATGGAPWADERRWAVMLSKCVEPYLGTPRDVVRLANAVQVHWAAVGGDVDLADLVALTTLRLFEPAVYRVVEEANERLVGVEHRYRQDEDFVTAFNSAGACRPKPAKATVASLFPHMASGLGAQTYHDSSRPYGRAHRRVSAAGHHRPYFAFGRDPQTPARDEINVILGVDGVGDAFNAALEARRDDYPATVRLIEELAAHIEAGRPLGDALLDALIKESDLLLHAADRYDPFAPNDLRDLLCDMVREGARWLGPSERTRLFARMIQAGAGLSLRARVIETDAMALGLALENSMNGRRSETVFATADVTDAIRTLAGEIASVCAGEAIWKNPQPRYLVQRWMTFEGREAPARWVAGLPDNRLADWAREIISHNRSQSARRVSTVRVFNRSSVNALFDVEPFTARLEALAATDADAASALAALREAETNARNF